jgi:hypothetical protein
LSPSSTPSSTRHVAFLPAIVAMLSIIQRTFTPTSAPSTSNEVSSISTPSPAEVALWHTT